MTWQAGQNQRTVPLYQRPHVLQTPRKGAGVQAVVPRSRPESATTGWWDQASQVKVLKQSPSTRTGGRSNRWHPGPKVAFTSVGICGGFLDSFIS